MIGPTDQARTSKHPFLTVAQLIVSLSGAFVSLAALAWIFIIEQMPQSSGGILAQNGDDQISGAVWFLILLIVLCVPSIVLSLRWLNGREPSDAGTDHWFIPASILLVLWVGLLFLSSFLQTSTVASTLLQPVSLLVIAIPLLWVLGFALRKIKTGSWKRVWGLITGTLFITLPLVLLIEGIIFVIAIITIGVSAAAQPQYLSIIDQLGRLTYPSPEQVDQLLNQITPLLTTPVSIFTLVFSFGLLIPLVEEFFKPLLLWGFMKNSFSPVQGFTSGLICGAAFALVESLFAVNSTGAIDFATLALGRTGTGLLHVFNSGMMGWALASTWQDGKKLRLSLVYGGVVVLHGTWNAFALILGFGTIPAIFPQEVAALSAAVPWLLGLMAIWMLTLLYVMNRNLQQQAFSGVPALEETTPEI